MKRLSFIIISALTALASLASGTSSDSTAIAQRIEVSFREAYVLPSNQIVKGHNRFGSKTRSAFGAAGRRASIC